MVKHAFIDIILVSALLIFSWWLMVKSFGYDTGASQFRVARHEVGDFGLHISLIRSFARGENVPAQSPFFPGKPLVYHYAIDWLVGQMVGQGIRIDYALNGVSAVALTVLLYSLYRLTGLLSHGSRIAGLLSIAFFLLPSNFSFVEILRQAPKNFSFFTYFWRYPDYLHQGPFDGSVITIYSTLAPYLNQRHLVAGMAIAVLVIWMAVRWLQKNKRTSNIRWIFVGIVIGFATRVHLVIALATGISVIILLFGKRTRALLLFAGAAVLASAPHLIELFSMRSAVGVPQFWNPGYLAPRPFFMDSWGWFWVYNLGALVLLLPFSYRLTDGIGRRLILGAAIIFVLANILQISYRIEHNHSLINYVTILSLPFIANLLVRWWQLRRPLWKIIGTSAFVILIASGLFNLMVVKNDYQIMIDDVGRSNFSRWVQTQTDPSSIFISKHALYDSIAIAGRKNYLGLEYYVSVMGYDYWGRRKQINTWLADLNKEVILDMKSQHIDYIAIPIDRKDFPYAVDEEKIKILLKTIYADDSTHVYAL